MRALSSATNIETGTTDYPNGRVRDRQGSVPGTLYNEVLHGDIIQFFQKLVIDAGITPNGNPDNVGNGYQLIDALVSKIAANGLNGLNTAWVQVPDITVMTLKGYDGNSQTVGTGLTGDDLITIPAQTTMLGVFGGALPFIQVGTDCYFKYVKIGTIVTIEWLMQFSGNLTSNNITNFRIDLPAAISNAVGKPTGTYSIGHNSVSEFPSGKFDCVISDGKLCLVCDIGQTTRYSGGFFNKIYPVGGPTSDGSGGVTWLMHGSMTYEVTP